MHIISIEITIMRTVMTKFANSGHFTMTTAWLTATLWGLPISEMLKLRENVHLRINRTLYYLSARCTRVADSDAHRDNYIMYLSPILHEKHVPSRSTISWFTLNKEMDTKEYLLHIIRKVTRLHSRNEGQLKKTYPIQRGRTRVKYYLSANLKTLGTVLPNLLIFFFFKRHQETGCLREISSLLSFGNEFKHFKTHLACHTKQTQHNIWFRAHQFVIHARYTSHRSAKLQTWPFVLRVDLIKKDQLNEKGNLIKPLLMSLLMKHQDTLGSGKKTEPEGVFILNIFKNNCM